jgi:hypothetical protein
MMINEEREKESYLTENKIIVYLIFKLEEK